MNDFYSKSLFEEKYLDHTLYRAKGRSGRGRPRKSDYSLFRTLQQKVNRFTELFIMSSLLTKTRQNLMTKK